MRFLDKTGLSRYDRFSVEACLVNAWIALGSRAVSMLRYKHKVLSTKKLKFHHTPVKPLKQFLRVVFGFRQDTYKKVPKYSYTVAATVALYDIRYFKNSTSFFKLIYVLI